MLLSNLLSCLQMKVSGGASHKKLLSPFWSGQIVLTRPKKHCFVHEFKLYLGKKRLLSICSFLLYVQEKNKMTNVQQN